MYLHIRNINVISNLMRETKSFLLAFVAVRCHIYRPEQWVAEAGQPENIGGAEWWWELNQTGQKLLKYKKNWFK